ncbi:MAG: hypothetical protein HQ509_01875 [Candidatus Marinimicrobia bacterium]|nr:hypothetical protein [Candidatus Neomarinimicrobiota bacterium]
MRKLFFVFFILVTVGLSQQHRLFWDGGDWKRIERKVDHNPELIYQVKAAYINGIMDARLYDYLQTWNVAPQLADSLFADITDYMSTKELVRAVDFFYEDAYNLTIPLPSALIIATMYAERMPMNMIDEYIKQSRFWINGLYMQLDERDGSDLLNEKLEKHRAKGN